MGTLITLGDVEVKCAGRSLRDEGARRWPLGGMIVTAVFGRGGGAASRGRDAPVGRPEGGKIVTPRADADGSAR
jgi:hypothetical protein